MALLTRANANAAFLTNNCYVSKLTHHDVMLRGIAHCVKKFSISPKFSRSTCFLDTCGRRDVTSNSTKNLIHKCHVVPHDKNYVPFEENIDRRRREAARSILVQVQSPNSSKELYAYCKQFGNLDNMHHYVVKGDMHFFLVEFNEPACAKAALKAATHINTDEIIPVHSPMLWFRNVKTARKFATKDEATMDSVVVTTDGSKIPDREDITDRLVAAKTVSEQMMLLHDAWKLDDIGIRLRFLTAHQLERSFLGLFPRIAVLPFGSSVNGFGRRGCDLDLVLSLENNKIEKSSSRLVFHTKSLSSDSKTQSKKLMETIADSMQFFVPGVTNVRRILQARVPIIKYDQILTGLECDLSMTNMVAVHMSELLCLYGETDYRVRPLVFTIRHWAQSIGLTNPTPGRWITNFSITLLVLFYLQQKRILPTLNELQHLAGTGDIRLTDHSVDCTFLRDVTRLPIKRDNENTENLESLLLGFFEYYSSFDFSAKAISLREGTSIFKPDYSPLYICNPLETMLNVSKNVSIEETERFKIALRNASWILETATDARAAQRGILLIFEQRLDIVSYVGGKRTVNLAALFKMPRHEEKKATSKSRTGATAPNKTNEHQAFHSQVDGITSIKKGRVKRR